MKEKETLLIIGMTSLILMILLKMFSIELPILDFLEGMFAGLSIVTNVCFLIRFGKEQKIKDNNKVF
jgi:hypothetical protein